jgi:predicted Zn-dependent peptidase
MTRSHTWLTALGAALLLAAAAPPAAAQGFDIRTHTLKNGMKLLVQEDHSIPNVALYLFYTAHPCQWPVVGWMSDIEAWTLDDLKNHFKMGYSPSNATMVVTGDVTFDEVVTLTQKYLEPIPSNPPPPRVATTEPPQLGARRITVRKYAPVVDRKSISAAGF